MKYRWAPSLGDFEESPEKIWGVEPYDPDGTDDCVFCGLYGLNDLHALWRYKGKKYVWFAGSDIRHLASNYWLDDTGEIRIDNKGICEWINKNCECWCENGVEHDKLLWLGIESKIAPSFLGHIERFPVEENRLERKRYYTSVSGDDFETYGWDKIKEFSRNNPAEYHFYGNDRLPAWSFNELKSIDAKFIFHGKVPKEQMNEECKTMTGCIRMTEFDGFSEILAKSVLWGQKPISLIDYPFLHAENPREELLKTLNKYPWNTK